MNALIQRSLLALALSTAALAQDDEEKTLGKTRSEWLQLLREHKEVRFRRAAILALEFIGPQQPVLSGLYEALEKDPDPQIRREVAQLLGRMGPDAKGAALALATALQKDAAGPVREAAAAALGGKLAEQAQAHMPALTAALKDKDAGTRAAAAETLKNLGEAARPALPALAELARDRKEDRHARVFALQVLSRWGKENADTATVFVEVLQDGETAPDVRAAAAEGLGRLGMAPPAGVAALGQALGAKSAELRRAAAVALTALGSDARSAWPAIKTALTEADSGLRYQLIRAAGALAKDQPEAVTVLAERAERDDTTENRLAAIQELGEAGAAARPAEPVLVRLAAQEARARLREAAAAALKKVKGG